MALERCLGCMKVNGGEERCSLCGFSADDYSPPEQLRPKLLLHNRYVVGKVVKVDGEGITYLGIDTQTNKGVYLREYMPTTLCTRQGTSLVISQGCEAKYKALMSDFLELYRHLASLRTLKNIIQVYDLFQANNTLYAVYEYFESITLTQYINENAGELDWGTVSRLFKPLLESLSVIHKSGVIHRGISPETIVLSDDRLVLIDFSITSLRMVGGEINPSIYVGYAAPEQYSKLMSHGEWTDVYAIAAVLYKSLSGTMPPEAPTRSVNDNLISLAKLNSTIPQAVSNAIELAMVYDCSTRTASIRELMMNLYYNKEVSTSATTAVFAADPNAATTQIPTDQQTAYTSYQPVDIYSDSKLEDEDTEEGSEEEGEEEKKKMSPLKKTLLIAAPIVLIVILLLVWLMLGEGCESIDDTSSLTEESSELESSEESSEEESSEEESSEEESSEEEVNLVSVPSFVGESYDDVVNRYSDRFQFEQKTDYSDDYAYGLVSLQNYSSGTEVEPGTKITLTVSKGKRYVWVPDEAELARWTADEFKTYVEEELYLNATVSSQTIYSDSVAKGNVVDLDGVLPGNNIDREKNPTIIIYVSAGPDPNAE